MKRTPLVLLSTVAGVAGVLALNPQGTNFATVNASDTTTSDSSTPAPSDSTTSDTSSSSNTTSTTKTSPTPTASTSSSSGVSKAVTGDAVFVRYGNVQLKVTAKNGKITDIVAVQLPDQDGRSMQISSAVEPMLKQQALQAQSANISGVSGATYTSGGYQQSLQSALDKLGIK